MNNEILKIKFKIAKIFFDLIRKIGMSVPENKNQIVDFIYDDIFDTEDVTDFDQSDVIESFKRWIESNKKYYD